MEVGLAAELWGFQLDFHAKSLRRIARQSFQNSSFHVQYEIDSHIPGTSLVMSHKFEKASVRPTKRKIDEAIRGKTARPKKRVRKQKEYHSSSDESDAPSENNFTPVNLEDSDAEDGQGDNSRNVLRREPELGPEDPHFGEEADSDESGSAAGDENAVAQEFSSANRTQRKPASKRNDPEAFSTSISKILSTKLSQTAKKDPVLSRSREAVQVSNDIANDRLEKRAKAKLRADRKEELEHGRVKDVLGLTTGVAGETAEEEKRLRKIAQKGVVKLFNAVRAAQVKGEEAARDERRKGTVGSGNREEKITEVSKQGFLDLINGKKKGKSIEET